MGMNYCRFFLFSFWQTLQPLIRDQAGNEWFVTQNSKSKPKPEPLFFFLQTNKQTNKQSHWRRRRRRFNNGISAAAATPQPPAPPARGSSDHLLGFLRSSHSIRAPLLSGSVSVRYRSSPSPSPLHLSMISLSFSLFTLLPFFLTDLRLTFILSLSIWYADRQRRWSNWSTRFSCSG